MSWRTNKLILLFRKLGRLMGVNKIISRLVLGDKYEESYDAFLQSFIADADIVWDIGGNVGYYSKIFSDAVGVYGKVFVFEPSPINFSTLKKNTHNIKNIYLNNFGLGSSEGIFSFEQGKDQLGATSKFCPNTESSMMVEIKSPQKIIASGDIDLPSIIKIDVEGFELEVLRGFNNALKNKKIKAIGVEIHFSELENMGNPNASMHIESLLVSSGFKLKWTDFSHLVAYR